MNSETSEPLPLTEQENPKTTNLSSQSSLEIVRLMNEEDSLVAHAVGSVLSDVARAVDKIVERLNCGGRLFYIGTGTSGRLGVLDASECPPTFGVEPDLVQGIIAGGYDACHRAVEASEDDPDAGIADLNARRFTGLDVLVGIAASGRTPYTVGALKFARSLGALTIAVTCAPDSPITESADISIAPVVGPEVVAGSTRLKAGTAQKMVLNMLSTAALAKLGYVTGNRMTSVQTRNNKLRARAVRILSAETGLDASAARTALDAANGDVPVALVMFRTKRNAADARAALAASKGVVQRAIEDLNKTGTGN
jgi:N-acetylmuramic acid 6-phosphate etherase